MSEFEENQPNTEQQPQVNGNQAVQDSAGENAGQPTEPTNPVTQPAGSPVQPQQNNYQPVNPQPVRRPVVRSYPPYQVNPSAPQQAVYNPNNQQYQFFQIKTKEDSSDWTIAEMSKREKKKSGSYKKSFLGFIFYNYLTFGAECSHCHFVSNNDFDKEVLLWQSYIEDGKRLQTENIALYEKIKDRIKNEFLDDMPSNFDSVFEEFIQNTFVHKSELQLTTYESQTMGKFFNHLADKSIPSNTNVIKLI